MSKHLAAVTSPVALSTRTMLRALLSLEAEVEIHSTGMLFIVIFADDLFELLGSDDDAWIKKVERGSSSVFVSSFSSAKA